ncbi:helix-turn-helix domain-containing protein [Nocardia sp. N2S4-5]|uniref:helix-turn-helix domain-containing protein n=1 Tax=Nocardia sp. N2S4-5 TaxID=3351565 RepID=UPI0037CD0CF0
MSAADWRTADVRTALRSKDIGAVIRAWRHHPAHGPRPVPQTDLARWLDITQGQLSRIENGRSRVRDIDKLSRYARVLGVPAELLWFEIDEPAPNPPPATERLRLPSGTVDVAAPAAKPVLADSLLSTLDEYVLTDNLAGPHALLPIVTQQVQFVEHLARVSRGRTRTKLRAVHARFAEFLGWLHQDAGNLRAAIEWTTTAAGIAREAHDDRLLSYIRMRQSNLAADSGNPHATIELAQAALRTPARLTPRLRAMAWRQLAHGHAQLGAAGDCAHDLEQAWDHATQPDGENDQLADYCTPEYIAMEAAACLVDLGHPDKAIATLEPRLPRWQPENRRDLGRGLALFAVALARTGQSDQALDVAEHALTITAETLSNRAEQQLYRVVRQLINADAPDHAAELRIALHQALR